MKGRINTLATLLCLSLVFAAGQSATASAAPLFHSEVEHTIGTGVNEGSIVFTTDAGTLSCKKVTGSGTISAKTVTEITLTHVTFSECTTKTIFGSIAMTVNMNGCDHLATADIEVHMVCPPEKAMTLTGPGCTITVRAQSATSVEYKNVGSGSTREVVVSEQGTNIHYVASGAFCSKNGTFTNGTAVGTGRITAENTVGAHVGIWWSDE